MFGDEDEETSKDFYQEITINYLMNYDDDAKDEIAAYNSQKIDPSELKGERYEEETGYRPGDYEEFLNRKLGSVHYVIKKHYDFLKEKNNDKGEDFDGLDT